MCFEFWLLIRRPRFLTFCFLELFSESALTLFSPLAPLDSEDSDGGGIGDLSCLIVLKCSGYGTWSFELAEERAKREPSPWASTPLGAEGACSSKGLVSGDEVDVLGDLRGCWVVVVVVLGVVVAFWRFFIMSDIIFNFSIWGLRPIRDDGVSSLRSFWGI